MCTVIWRWKENMDTLFLKELGKKIWDYACVFLFYFSYGCSKTIVQNLKLSLWESEWMFKKKKKASSVNSDHPSPSFCQDCLTSSLSKSAHRCDYANWWMCLEIPRSSSKVLTLKSIGCSKMSSLKVIEVCPPLWSPQGGLSSLTCPGLLALCC